MEHEHRWRSTWLGSDRLLARNVAQPVARFLRIEAASGVLLLLAALVAVVWANSGWSESYSHLLEAEAGISIGGFHLEMSVQEWINDGLMAIFFFVAGLEIKREMVVGELSDRKAAAGPVLAAVGGMIVPALIYFALQSGQPGERGWGVPMATDIAFVVGVMALLGPRVPFGLKIMLLSLAIADDIGAVVVIAVFYSAGLSWVMLGLAASGLGAVYLMNRIGVRSVGVYAVVGAGVWLAMLKSGVHPTIAGVILGLMTPSWAWVGEAALRMVATDLVAKIEAIDLNPEAPELETLSFAARESVSPLERLEGGLHPWVGFVIMPLFALVNAGVAIKVAEVTSPVAVAVALGLFLGKPIGIVLFSWLAVKAGVAKLPAGVNWVVLLGGGFLAGIGFTMSLFVAGLALPPELLAAGKIGTLCGSLASAIVGATILVLALRKRQAKT